MEKFYITSDKVGEFVARMYAAGINVSVEPQSNQIVVTKPEGGYEWIRVFNKGSFDELCAALIPPTNNPNSRG